MPDYPISKTDLASDYCPDPNTWNQILADFAGKMFATLPEIVGVIVQESERAVADQNKLWVKTTGSAPYVVGALIFQGGAWRYVPGPPTYFADSSGSPNIITIATGESMSTLAELANRIFIVRVANANTGAVTITVDAIAAKDLRKNNNDAFIGSELEAGMLILVYYDSIGGYFQVVNTLNEAATERVRSAVVKAVKSAGTKGQQVFSASAAAVTVELTTLEDPGSLVTTFSSNQFTLPAGTYLIDVFIPILRAGDDCHMQAILYNATDGSTITTGRADKEGGGGGPDNTVAVIKSVFTIANPKAIEIRVQADTTYPDFFLGGCNSATSIGGVTEVYTQASIIKLA